MATISFAGATQSQIAVNIGHNGSTVNRYKLYYSGGLWEDVTFTATTTHSAQRYITGLMPDTSYKITVMYFNGTTQIGAEASGTWSTLGDPVPGATSITGFSYGNPNQYAPTTVTAYWSSASGATSYDYEVPTLGISGNTTSTSFSFYASYAGGYTFKVTPRNAAGLGSGDSRTFTLYTRPGFNWDYPKVSGQSIMVSASEWNRFTSMINEFRSEKSLSRYGFSSAVSGGNITAEHINQARNAINPMNPSVSIPDYCSAGITDISAYYFNRLKDSLNSVF